MADVDCLIRATAADLKAEHDSGELSRDYSKALGALDGGTAAHDCLEVLRNIAK